MNSYRITRSSSSLFESRELFFLFIITNSSFFTILKKSIFSRGTRKLDDIRLLLEHCFSFGDGKIQIFSIKLIKEFAN